MRGDIHWMTADMMFKRLPQFEVGRGCPIKSSVLLIAHLP